MRIPPSPHFTPIVLTHAFNVDRARLDGGLGARAEDAVDWSFEKAFGNQTYKGIPFALGEPGRLNVILLAANGTPNEVRIDLEPARATYVVFLHAVADRPLPELPGFGEHVLSPSVEHIAANQLGDHVADYVLIYEDGTQAVTPVLRRFAIQQRHIVWGASPFAAVPALGPYVFNSATDDYSLGRPARMPYGTGETRHDSGRSGGENLWLYALPNPSPEKPIRGLLLSPREERSVIYGISVTNVTEHPLRERVRQKLKLTLPAGVKLNGRGELNADDQAAEVALDLGVVLSARAALGYDEDRWLGGEPDVQPESSTSAVVVEYAAHPRARLHVQTGDETSVAADLSPSGHGGTAEPMRIEPIAAADRPVRIRVIDKVTGQPVSVRLHVHGQAGEYLPPHGRHRKVNRYWFEDNYGEFVNDLNQYSYIPGECVVDLPLGRVFVEITRGYEIAPIRTAVELTAKTEELTFELERRLPWRERGWVTADTHVHFLSPQTALLEGQAEGVNVVNLLASQWGEMFSNVSDFDGKTTLGARDFGGDGEFLVRVGTENRMQVLGHISLLGYSGAMITPLCTGGPAESAIGDPQELTMAEWAQRCIDQGGLVVMPHAPNPQCERAADVVLDLIHAIEMMTFNPHQNQIGPYGLADWYRFLNIGHQIAICGGSDKMSASSLLGGVRTYAHLGERDFSYGNWMDAVRAGNTFVTVGPLIEFAVDGQPAGQTIKLPASGGTVDVTWTVESVRTPIEQVEVVVGGLVAEQVDGGGKLSVSGAASVRVTESTWIALRVRGSLRGRPGDIAAHSSAVMALVGDAPVFCQTDAVAVLEQIEGAIAFVDTIAARPEARRYTQLRVTLEAAHKRLHGRLHQQGVAHLHTPLHGHDVAREH